MVKLSVNVNKVATVRNSRGGRVPSVLDAVRVCIDAGAPGITVHPRADARHITVADVQEIADESGSSARTGGIQHRRRPPAGPGRSRPGRSSRSMHARASHAGGDHEPSGMAGRHASCPARTHDCLAARAPAFASVFSSIRVRTPFNGPRHVGARRVELYTEPFARAFERGPKAAAESYDTYVAAADARTNSGLASTRATIWTCRI